MKPILVYCKEKKKQKTKNWDDLALQRVLFISK